MCCFSYFWFWTLVVAFWIETYLYWLLMDILIMRVVKVNKGKLWLREDEIDGFIEKTVTPTGNSGKVDVPLRYVGKKAYVIVCKK